MKMRRLINTLKVKTVEDVIKVFILSGDRKQCREGAGGRSQELSWCPDCQDEEPEPLCPN